MNYALLTVSIMLFVFTIMVPICLRVSYDLFSNIGTVQVKAFGITMFQSKITIIGDYLNFSNDKAKVIKVKLDINDFSFQFFNEFSGYIKNKILPTYFLANVQICLENPFVASMIAGSLKTIVSYMVVRFLATNHDMEAKSVIESGYRHNIITIKMQFAFVVTFYDLLWSVIRSVIVIRRRNEKHIQPKQNNVRFHH